MEILFILIICPPSVLHVKRLTATEGFYFANYCLKRPVGVRETATSHRQEIDFDIGPTLCVRRFRDVRVKRSKIAEISFQSNELPYHTILFVVFVHGDFLFLV